MGYLRQVRGMLALGHSMEEACREIGVSEKIYLRWLSAEEHRRRNELAKENSQLKQMLADMLRGNAHLNDKHA